VSFLASSRSALLRLHSDLYFSHLESPFAILEARKAIEPQIAAIAAKKRSSEQLTNLSELLKAAEADPTDRVLFYEAGRTFHLSIGECTGNPVLHNVMSLVYELMGQPLWLAVTLDSVQSIPGEAESSVLQHRAVFEAISAEDSKAAAARMLQHLQSVEKSMMEADLDASGRLSVGSLEPPR
jgi:GntR family transcriptional repressor for pyruvate dehydrogenase complex